ncbi:MAG: class I SAM-dependent methyltransferase [Gammaproteobacteria bacterium]|nr:class I SAM-dependent methyltransferase [Gammaproteobacteria bacterium]
MAKPLHPFLPELQHDDVARLDFVKSLRRFLSTRVLPGNAKVYEQRVIPRFRATHGREPATRDEIRAEMVREPYYQLWSALQRRSQEMLWEAAIEPIQRELPELIKKANAAVNRPDRRGSLRLNPDLPLPAYNTEMDIHIQPGGYHHEWANDDIAAGAIYEIGVGMYMPDAWGAEGDYLGQLAVANFRRAWPDRKPRRILDMGCTIGSSTTAWARAFPEAEVHGIDVGAPVLRYAHVRSEALGVPIHFSQQNAEATEFEPGSFDLVVSQILIHETSLRAMPRIFAESRRLLAPGGLMIHMDIPRGANPFKQFMHDWESYNNNEGFARFMTGLDLEAVAVEGGWQKDELSVERVIPNYDKSQMAYGDEYPYTVLIGNR